jgi:hypothetical protein
MRRVQAIQSLADVLAPVLGLATHMPSQWIDSAQAIKQRLKRAIEIGSEKE